MTEKNKTETDENVKSSKKPVSKKATLVDNNGEELLADNILFRSNKLGIKSKNFVQEQRYLMSNKVINKYMWITGGVILVNPLPAVDFLTTTSVNLQMIMELSKIYEIKLTKKDAKDLATHC